MHFDRVTTNLLIILLKIGFAYGNIDGGNNIEWSLNAKDEAIEEDDDIPSRVFDGVYSDCFLHFSYSCIQNRTLNYLIKLNELREVKILGDFVKFVKVYEDSPTPSNATVRNSGETLSQEIDNAIDVFFDDHVLKFNPTGKDLPGDTTMEEFVGRKKRKGGGGGGDDDGGGKGDHKKKMMMMAMMCMKMKMLMMVPAMMGMMSMMSFKGMMFSMMSFMIAKLMLLMKILEKKNGSGGGGGDAWMSGGGGGAWMPAGTSDGYGGPGGGYNAAGEWQNGRSYLDQESISRMSLNEAQIERNKPQISFVTPYIRITKPFSKSKKNKALKYRTIIDNDDKKSIQNKEFFMNWDEYSNKGSLTNLSDVVNETTTTIDEINKEINDKADNNGPKPRNKRGVMDFLNYFSSYMSNRLYNFYLNNFRSPYPKYKIINGVKYVYAPNQQPQNIKYPKITPAAENQNVMVKDSIQVSGQPIVTIEDFHRGEIMEDTPEERMLDDDSLKKLSDINEALDDNPWQ